MRPRRRDGAVSIPLGAPSTFETRVGAARSVAFAKLSLRHVRPLKEHFGVTINDVVLAICSGALRSHLADHEEETVGQSAGGRGAGFGPRDSGRRTTWATGSRPCSSRWPTTSPHPLDRLRAIAATSAPPRRRSGPSVTGRWRRRCPRPCPGAGPTVIRLGIQVGALRRLRAGNLMISNVPGPNFPLYFAGMRMMAAYPLGPGGRRRGAQHHGAELRRRRLRRHQRLRHGRARLPGLARSIVDELGHLIEAVERNVRRTSGPRAPPRTRRRLASSASSAAVPGRGLLGEAS